ncbi:hypothetical protein MLPF_3373 [Mycobacterium lepromatosis]|nr:hypothetical protein MLPF_3373 [Mycobacterium lepromatosis]
MFVRRRGFKEHDRRDVQKNLTGLVIIYPYNDMHFRGQ